MSKLEKFMNHEIIKTWSAENCLPIGKFLVDTVKENSSILLIGTGKTRIQYEHWPIIFEDLWNASSTFIEIFQGYIDQWTKEPYPIIKGDVRYIDKVIEPGQYDLIMWSQGPEHIAYNEMLPTFDLMYDLSNVGILCLCPWGGFYDSQETVEGNPYEAHVQKSMSIDTFGAEFFNYHITQTGKPEVGGGQILITRGKKND